MKDSCLCGAVVYEVAQLDMPISHCNCTTCMKALRHHSLSEWQTDRH